MYYIRHFYIYPYDNNLKSILENEYGIPCEVLKDPFTDKETSFVFDVSDLHPRIDDLNKVLPEDTLHKLPDEQGGNGCAQERVLVSYHPQYSEDERRRAKWLCARNITSKIVPVNCETVDGHECFIKKSKLGYPIGRHELQNEPYVIKSSVKWGRSAFVSAQYHTERLFCNDTIRTLLNAQGITGVHYLPVIKKTTKQPMNDIYQLSFTHTIPDGAVIGIARMEDYVCDQCGMHMLRWGDGRSHFGLRNGILDENIDLWQTQPMFLGSAPTEAVRGSRQLIISQRLYRVLKDNKLDRGFAFTPLDMVDV